MTERNYLCMSLYIAELKGARVPKHRSSVNIYIAFASAPEI